MTMRDDDERAIKTLTAGRRAHSAYGWSRRLWDFLMMFKTKGEAAVAIGAAGVVAGGAALTAVDAARTEAPIVRTVPAIVEAATERWGDNAVAYLVEGHDEAGRRALFDFVVLDKAFAWAAGRTDQLIRAGSALSAADIDTHVLGPDVRRGLSRAIGIIAVGVASQEGAEADERERARRRAEQTARWIDRTAPAKGPLWTLNLGQYARVCSQCETQATSWQRPFIVVGVREMQAGTDVGQALADAMSSKANLPSVASYSTFELSRLR